MRGRVDGDGSHPVDGRAGDAMQRMRELAEQNARLVAAVELLRVRTRVLIVAVVVLAVGVVVLLAR